MDLEDVARGWKERRKVFTMAKPKVFADDLPLSCDSCGDIIPDGSEAVATTMWDTNREGEPALWEIEYLTLTPNAYDMHKPKV